MLCSSFKAELHVAVAGENVEQWPLTMLQPTSFELLPNAGWQLGKQLASFAKPGGLLPDQSTAVCLLAAGSSNTIRQVHFSGK